MTFRTGFFDQVSVYFCVRIYGYDLLSEMAAHHL